MKKQRGGALIISLFLLLAITLVSLAGIGTVTSEEKMAGNNRDQQLAFQAAEAALREGENYVQNTANLSTLVADTCANGLCTRRELNTGYSASAVKCSSTWFDQRWIENDCPNNLKVWSTAGKHRVYSGNLAEIASKPKFIIEFVSYINPDPSSSDPGVLGDPELYRITALATGGTNTARVMLQSTYKKTP